MTSETPGPFVPVDTEVAPARHGRTDIVVRNTALTLVRMVLTFGVGLLAARFVLQALGETDFGLLTSLGGGLYLVSVLDDGLRTSLQRHLAFAIGRGDVAKARSVFNNGIVLYGSLALLAGLAGILLMPVLMAVIKIPEDRIGAARLLYLAVLAQVTLVMAVAPFSAAFVARQRLGIPTGIRFLQSFATLAIAVVLTRYAGDRLVAYGVLNAVAVLTLLFAQAGLAAWLIPEARFERTRPSRRDMSELLAFGGWAVLGSMAWSLRYRVGAVLLGAFFLPSLVAGYGVALQVNAYAQMLAGVAWMVTAPAMTQLVAQQEKSLVRELAKSMSKLNGLLVLGVFAPLLVLMPEVLSLWLGDVPPGSVTMTRLVVGSTCLSLLVSGVTVVIYAADHVRSFALLQTGLTAVQVALAIIGFFMVPDHPELFPAVVFVTGLLWIPTVIVIYRRASGLGVRAWMREVLVPCAVTLLPPLALLALGGRLLGGTTGILLGVAGYALALVPLAWRFGLDDRERDRLARALAKFLPRPT